jgi:antitoxin YefM
MNGPRHCELLSATVSKTRGAFTWQPADGSRPWSIRLRPGSTRAASPGGHPASSLTERGYLTIIRVITTQSLAAVKAHFSQVIDEVAGTHQRVTVTKNGSPVAVILAVEDYESLMETLEILSDPNAPAEIRQAESQMCDGEVYDEAEVRAALAARRA